MKPLHIYSLGIAVVALLTSHQLSAWTAPSSNPPSNNVAAPLHTGSGDQSKSGSLGVDGFVNEGNSMLLGGDIFFNQSGTSGDFLRYQTVQGVTYHENGAPTWRLAGNGDSFINGGDVGIGTTNPDYKLHVAGDIGVNAIRFGTGGYIGSGGEGLTLRDDQNNTSLWLRRDQVVIGDDANNDELLLRGNVGINTSPNQELHVRDGSGGSAIAIIEGDGDSSAELRLLEDSDHGFVTRYNPTENRLELRGFASGSSEDWDEGFYIDRSSGNVGIGVSQPNDRLDVRGNIAATGQVRTSTYCDESGGNCINADDQYNVGGIRSNISFSGNRTADRDIFVMAWGHETSTDHDLCTLSAYINNTMILRDQAKGNGGDGATLSFIVAEGENWRVEESCDDSEMFTRRLGRP